MFLGSMSYTLTDGSIRVWDLRIGVSSMGAEHTPPVASVMDAHLNGRRRRHQGPMSVTGVVWAGGSENETMEGKCPLLLSTGAGDEEIRAWDCRRLDKPCLLSSFSLSRKQGSRTKSHGFVTLTGSKTGLVAALSTESKLYVLDSLTMSLCRCMEAPPSSTFHVSTFYIKCTFNPQGTLVASGSSDGNLYVWDIESESNVEVLGSHSAEVTAVDWSPSDPMQLCSVSDDNYIKLWKAQPKFLSRFVFKAKFKACIPATAFFC